MLPAWRNAVIAISAASIVLLYGYHRTMWSMVEIWWRSETFTHGFLILPLSAYMVWRRRQELAKIRPEPSVWGLVLLAVVSFGWLLAHIVNVLVLEQAALIGMFVAVVFTLLGSRVVRCISFPLGYLIFAVPFGEFLVPSLQDFTATFSVKALQLTGMPVFREGRHLFIPSGAFEVEQACSGVRYLIASVALGVLYAYMTYRSLWRRILFVALAAVVPIIANGVRAYLIIMLAHISDYQLAVGIDHLIYGWLFFGAVMLFLFWLGTLFRDEGPYRPKITSDRPELTRPTGAHAATTVLAALGATVLLASSPMMAAWSESRLSAGRLAELRLPTGSSLWTGPYRVDDGWRPVFHGATSERIGEYRKDGKELVLYIAYYAMQEQGAELVNVGNRAYESARWKHIATKRHHVDLSSDSRLPVRAEVIGRQEQHLLLWQWYEINGIGVASPLAAKALEAWFRIRGEFHGAATIVLAAEFDLDESEAADSMRSFVRQTLPGIRSALSL